jgi:hypothetical protein
MYPSAARTVCGDRRAKLEARPLRSVASVDVQPLGQSYAGEIMERGSAARHGVCKVGIIAQKRTLEQRKRSLSRYHLAVEQTHEAYPLAV